MSSEQSQQLPEWLNDYMWFFATVASNKVTRLLQKFADDNRGFYAKSVEGTLGFHEPESDDVEYVAWLKNMMGLYLTGHIAEETLLRLAIIQKENLDVNPGPIDIKLRTKKETLSISGDVSTAYAENFEDFYEGKNVIHFHNLKRQTTSDMSDDEKNRLIFEDKNIWKKRFSKPFWVRFRIGNSVNASDNVINKTAKVEFFVKFKGFSEEEIDAAYADPNVVNIGPRINLGMHVLPQYVEKVIMVDDIIGKSRDLEENEYLIVENAVVGAVLPEHYYVELFKPNGPNRFRQ